METQNTKKKPNQVCKLCDYTTCNKYDFTRHELSAKHKKYKELYELTQSISSQNVSPQSEIAQNVSPQSEITQSISPQNKSTLYKCECNKICFSNTTLWRHQKKCNKIHTNIVQNLQEINSNIVINSYDYALNNESELNQENGQIIESVQYQSNIQETNNISIVLEESNRIQENNQVFELHNNVLQIGQSTDSNSNAQLMQLIQTITTELRQTITTEIRQQMINQSHNYQQISINANNHISLDNFLNIHCICAMTLDNFLKSIVVTEEDILSMITNKTVGGYYGIINKHLKMLDITQRPIHCNDTKRHVNYVFTNNGWEKEKTKHQIIRKIFYYICKLSKFTISDIVDSDPEYEIKRTVKYELRLSMMYASIGNSIPEYIILEELSKLIEDQTHLNTTKMLSAIRQTGP